MHAATNDDLFRWYLDRIPAIVPRDEAAAMVSQDHPGLADARRRWIQSQGRRAQKTPSSPPLPHSEVSMSASYDDTRLSSQFQQAVDREIAKGVSRPEAMKACCRRLPRERAAWIRQYNESRVARR